MNLPTMLQASKELRTTVEKQARGKVVRKIRQRVPGQKLTKRATGVLPSFIDINLNFLPQTVAAWCHTRKFTSFPNGRPTRSSAARVSVSCESCAMKFRILARLRP
jgi:hypothetical protein